VIIARSVQAGREAHDASDDQFRRFVELYGGCAREAYARASNPNSYNNELKNALKNLTAQNIQKTLGSGAVPHYVDSGISHIILSLFPKVDEGKRTFTMAPPTSHIRDMLMKHISLMKQETRNDIWEVLLGHSLGKSLAGNIMDANHHRVLLTDGPLWPLYAMERKPLRRTTQVNYHVRCRSMDNGPVAWLLLQEKVSILNDPVELPVGRGEMRVMEAEELALPLTLHTYYRPRSKNPPTFHSFILAEPSKAVVFQASVGGTHDNILLGFENLKTRGVEEIIYVIVTHATNVGISFPRMLDNGNYPKISHYYLLTLPHI